MKNAIITFNTDGGPGTGWTSVGENHAASLCSEEFDEYVDLPDDVETFDAVFSVGEPVGSDHFKLVGWSNRSNGPSLDSRNAMGLMNGAKELIGDMHSKGYRYLKVVY